MTLDGAWLTLLIALVSAQPPDPSWAPSYLPWPPPQYWPEANQATIAPQQFTISANTWQIINMGPWGSVYGIPLCNPQMYRSGGWVVTVRRQFPYVLPGSAGTSTRFVAYGQPVDLTGESWILDNGWNDGKNFSPLPNGTYANSVTRPFPTADEWPWLEYEGAQPFNVLYVYVQNVVGYGTAQPAPYNIVVQISYGGAPAWVPAMYPSIPLYNQRPDNLESWRANAGQSPQSHIFPFSQFAPFLNYPGGPPGQPGLGGILFLVVYNVRQLVSPFNRQIAIRVKYQESCPQCTDPGYGWILKVGLPVCAPLGQFNFSVRIIVAAMTPTSYFEAYACSPEQAWSSQGDPTGYGCNPDASPKQWTDARGSLYSDITMYNQSFVWLSVISRTQYRDDNNNLPLSQINIMATSYPGRNLTETEWLEDFSVPLSVYPGSSIPNPVPYYLMWQNLFGPSGNFWYSGCPYGGCGGPPLGQLTF